MKSTSKKLSTSVEFTVEFDQKDFEPARLKALERLARNIKVPGFRNGKAPANIVEQHVDPNDLASQTLDIVVRQAIPKLYTEAGLTPISIPHVDVKKYVPGEMAELTITSDIMPDVKLGDYENVKVVYDEPEVTDDDVEDVLRRIAESYAEPKVVKRAAKNGDEVILISRVRKMAKLSTVDLQKIIIIASDLDNLSLALKTALLAMKLATNSISTLLFLKITLAQNLPAQRPCLRFS